MSSRMDTASRCRARKAGVFYTHDDVTAYIAERTILPRLLDLAAARCPDAFRPDGGEWKLLAADPDRYIPAALRQEGRRHLTLRRRLRSGTVVSVNDLVTLNLDIARWVTDLVSSDSDVRAALIDAVRSITVLDPTCGDGAFLKAAIRVLEGVHPPGDSVMIRRSILTNNLFGVDLRREAVAECKRNLLAMLTELLTAAEPIRRCRERAPSRSGRAGDSMNHRRFAERHGGRSLQDSRHVPLLAQQSINPAAALPDLAKNIRCGNALKLDWESAFPRILRAGGFDAIIGNPPYVAADRASYRVQHLRTSRCPDVYAWVLERAATLLRTGGRCGMIVPLSLAFSGDFAACRDVLFAEYECNWFSSFGRIPAALFASDIRVRNVIHLGRKEGATPQAAFTTRLHRWFEEERPQLFAQLEYAPFHPGAWSGRVPKIGSARLLERFAELRQRPARLGDLLSASPTPHALHYKQTAYNWLTFCRDLPPCFDEAGQPCPQTQFDVLYFRTAWQRDAAMLLLNGKWMFAYWIAVGDDFHVARWMLADFPVELGDIPPQRRKRLRLLARRLERAMERAVSFKRNAGKRVGTYNLARCRKITDQSDQVFAALLGLEDVWEDVERLCAQVVKTDFAVEN